MIIDETLGKLTFHHYAISPIENEPFYGVIKEKDFFNLGKYSTIAFIKDVSNFGGYTFFFGPKDLIKLDVGLLLSLIHISEPTRPY